MKDLRWQEAKTLQESIVFIEECWLMWEQEQKIIRKNYRWLKSKSSHCFDVGVGDSSDGSRTAGDDGLGGDENLFELYFIVFIVLIKGLCACTLFKYV